MTYTPVELRHVKLTKTLVRGYQRAEVDRLIEDVIESFEDVWRDRGELTDRVHALEQQLADFKQREHLLASTLVSAEKAAAEAKDAAKRQAELVVAEAHGEARSITRAAQNERERLFAESRRVEALLRSALGVVEETAREQESESDGGGEPRRTSWPRRDDTREFPSLVVPPPAVERDADEHGHEAEHEASGA